MSNAQKTPFSRGMTLYINQLVRKFLDRLAKGRPATLVSLDPTGTIATVNFEIAGVQLPQVTMPVAGSEYIRLPLQPGCKGLCVPSDFYLGAMSGLGSGTADTTPRGTLSTLVFLPIGNKNFAATDDPQAVVLYGPNGAIIRDTSSVGILSTDGSGNFQYSGQTFSVNVANEISFTCGSTQLTITPTGVTITVGGQLFLFTNTALNVPGTGAVNAFTIAGNVVTAVTSLKVNGVEMSGHTHNVAGVQTGGSTVVSGVPN